MVVRTTPRLAKFGPRLRNAVLILFALFVAHDAIYVVQFGAGARFATAMTVRGHDGYWAPVSLIIGLAAAATFLAALAVISRLERQAASVAPEPSSEPGYLHELASTWLRLFPTVGVLFLLQENVEHFLVGGHLAGLGAVLGPDALPVLAATTFGVAALGSIVRWRIRVLEALVAATKRPIYARPSALRQPREWADIAAAAPHRWTLARRDAGRAPPLILLRNIVAPA